MIAPWPNSYTFTKSYSERSLEKHRGNIPLLILRPSVIICAQSDPYPGWIDTLSAAGALSTVNGLGFFSHLDTDLKTRADLIPVDFVANGIIIGTAY